MFELCNLQGPKVVHNHLGEDDQPLTKLADNLVINVLGAG
jgi:hypothetical protein